VLRGSALAISISIEPSSFFVPMAPTRTTRKWRSTESGRFLDVCDRRQAGGFGAGWIRTLRSTEIGQAPALGQ